MIRKAFEFDPMICSKCGGTTKIIAFISEAAVVDRIIDDLKLRFVADGSPLSPMNKIYFKKELKHPYQPFGFASSLAKPHQLNDHGNRNSKLKKSAPESENAY